MSGSIRLADEKDLEGSASARQHGRRLWVGLAAVFCAVCLLCSSYKSPPGGFPFAWLAVEDTSSVPDLYEATFAELQRGLEDGLFTSVDLTKAYLARIDEVNRQGPGLRAVIAINTHAADEAAQKDADRAAWRKTVNAGMDRPGPLFGLPIIIKDNIDAIGMSTTAGSYALNDTVISRDATVVARLRAAGAIILAKANMDQFAGLRDIQSNAWSSVGGICTSAYFPSGSPSGSSGGSGVACSVGLAAATLGTDTTGSVVSPASFNNLVGLRSTIGLIPRTGVVPMTLSRDTVGPMCRTVTDCAHLLSVLAGPDENDTYTRAPLSAPVDYIKGLRKDALKGVRLGVPRKGIQTPMQPPRGRHVSTSMMDTELLPAIEEAFDEALDVLRNLGATIIENADFEDPSSFVAIKDEKGLALALTEFAVDFNVQLGEYLSTVKEIPSGVKTLSDVVEWSRAHPELERPPGKESLGYLETAAKVGAKGYDTKYLGLAYAQRTRSRDMAYDVLLKHRLDAIILPSCLYLYGGFPNAGLPVVTVPLGFLPDDTPLRRHPNNDTLQVHPHRPFGLAFAGRAFAEEALLSYAYAFEQATQHRLGRKAYAAAVPKTQIRDVQES